MRGPWRLHRYSVAFAVGTGALVLLARSGGGVARTIVGVPVPGALRPGAPGGAAPRRADHQARPEEGARGRSRSGGTIVRILQRLDPYDVAFLALSVALFLVVWDRVTEFPGLLGPDNGNYLLTMRRVFGDDPTGLGVQRPPLIALPLKLATSIFSLVVATKLLAVLAWLAAGVPTYYLIKRLVGAGPGAKACAVTGAVGYLLTTMFASMLVWGWITFLGMAFIPVIALLLVSDSAARGWSGMLVLGAVLALLASAHQVGAMFVVAWLAPVCVGLLAMRDWRTLRLLVGGGLVGLLASWWLVALYLDLGGGTDERFASLGLRPWDTMSAGFTFFFRDPHIGLWFALLALAPVGLVRLAAAGAAARGPQAAVVMASLLIVPFALFASNEALSGRMLYFAALPMWALASVAVAALAQAVAGALSRGRMRSRLLVWVLRPAFAVALVALSLVLFDHFDARLSGAMRFFGFIDERHAVAAEYVASDTDPGARLIAYPFAFGWWLEGAVGRDAFEIGRFGNEEQNAQAAVAEEVLVGNHAIWNGAVLVGDSFPLPTAGTPQVWLALPLGERVPLVSLDDGNTVLRLLDEADFVRELTLQQLERGIEITESPDAMSTVKQFRYDAFEVIQETTIQPGRYGWTVTYHFSDPARDLASVTVPVFLESLRSVAIDEVTGTVRTTHRLRDHLGFQYNVELLMQVEVADATVTAALQPPTGSAAGAADAVFVTVAPTGRQVDLTLSFEVVSMTSASEARPVAYDLQTLADPTLEYVRADDLTRDAAIDYVAVDLRPTPGRIRPLPAPTVARLEASPVFEPVFVEGDIAIYRVHPERWSIDEAGPDVALAAPPLELSPVEISLEPGIWAGPRVGDVRRVLAPGRDDLRAVIAADVDREPDRWSGLVLSTERPIDWSGAEHFYFQFRWQSLEGLTRLAVGVIDDEGRRWAWNSTSDAAAPSAEGWISWTLSRDDATRADDGFAWDRIVEFYVTALAGDDAAGLPLTELQVATVGALYLAAALPAP